MSVTARARSLPASICSLTVGIGLNDAWTCPPSRSGAAQLSNAVLATQAFQHDADLLFSGMMPACGSANIPDCLFSALPYALARLFSSLLLSGATMSQQSSLTQSAHSVRQVLTAYTIELVESFVLRLAVEPSES